MDNITLIDVATPISRIQAVAFGQPMIECSGLGVNHVTYWLIMTFKGGRLCAMMGAVSAVLYGIASRNKVHSGVVIGQMKSHAGGGLRTDPRQAAQRLRQAFKGVGGSHQNQNQNRGLAMQRDGAPERTR